MTMCIITAFIRICVFLCVCLCMNRNILNSVNYIVQYNSLLTSFINLNMLTYIRMLFYISSILTYTSAIGGNAKKPLSNLFLPPIG